MDRSFIDAGIEAAAHRLFDRHNGPPPPGGVRPAWSNTQPAVQNHWRAQAAPAVIAALEVVDAMHALSTTFVVATVQTAHFEFEGVGADEHEAGLAVQVAWERHARAYDTELDYARDLANDVTFTTYTIGKSYRDGSEI
jgi:hypothetical protein